MRTMLFNFYENILWIGMCVSIWPIDSQVKRRLVYSFIFAAVLALIQTWRVA